MKRRMWLDFFLIVFLLALGGSFTLRCEAAAAVDWEYQLLEGSTLLDDCPVCDRLSMPIPMRGSFHLRLLQAGPFKTRYALERIDFRASTNGNNYQVTGSGWFDIGGDFAVTQSAYLDTAIASSFETNHALLTNNSALVTRRFPMMAVQMNQTNGTLAHTFTLQINAAPLRELWFSTESFHDGDLLSMKGRVVKTNGELQAPFPGPKYANVGLDAMDILPGAELAFSIGSSNDVFSDGDLALARSAKILKWPDLLAPLAPIPVVDPGLDALSFETADRIYFSVKRNVNGNEGLLQYGDILWTDLAAQQGGVFRKNSDLLARFNPEDRNVDSGLDALYIWPSGEIWFSTQFNFTDTQLGLIGQGDLLSDNGYIVYRNGDLVAAFKPTEARDYGLDALTIVTDVGEVPKAFSLQVGFDLAKATVALDWKASGRVFQVERADEVTGVFAPISEIIPELHWQEPATSAATTRFYRVRQW